jgi:predicted amidohydrolase YtcJ
MILKTNVWLLLTLALTVGSLSVAPAAETSGPITVFTAKKIITMNPGWPEATAVAVRDGKIISVGTLEDLKPWLDKFPHVIDKTFKDKILTPGFIEPHGHPIVGGMSLTRPLLTYLPTPNPYGPDFPGVKTHDEAMTKLRDYVAQAESPDQPLLVWGYDVVAMGGHLDKTDLDKISTTQPILVWDASEHFIYANTPALRQAKITREHTKTDGIMAGDDGEPNGQFLGVNAALVILQPSLAKLLQPEVALKNTKFLMDLSRQNGMTTTSELVFGKINPDLEWAVIDSYFNAPDSPMRCVVVTDGVTFWESKGEKGIEYVRELQNRNTDKVIFNGVKFFSDDSFLSLGMEIDNPGYIGDYKGLFMVEPGAAMLEQWRPWWEAGFQIHVHTNGNAGNQATLDTLEALQKIKPRFNHRFTFQHYGISTPEQARMIATLGGVVSTNPYYLYYRGELTAPEIGTDRAYTAARLKTLVDAGVPTSLHTDTPVAPPFALEEIWIAVNRFGLSGKVLAPAERITVHQAMRMVTIDAAYTLGVEDRIGSIAAGKYADFAVLEKDPYTVAPEKIRDIKVWGTVVGGKVYPASEIRP